MVIKTYVRSDVTAIVVDVADSTLFLGQRRRRSDVSSGLRAHGRTEEDRGGDVEVGELHCRLKALAV